MARVAFVMEQTLGHVTHARNLASVLAERPEIQADWLPIPFEVDGLARLLPYYRGNWSVRASWRARRALDAAETRGPLDGLMFHTQCTALFSVDRMRRTPAVISLDATPLNYDQVSRIGGYTHRPSGEGFLDRQKYLMNRRAFQAAAALVPWSAWARRSLIDEYGADSERIHVLAPGAAAEFFALGERRLVLDVAAGPGEPVKILFVGGDWTRKGGPVLLEALAGLPSGSWRLDVVTREPVPTTPGVTVHYGVGPNSVEMLRRFAEADLFVLPSLGECLAVVLMEATAAGLPVVTTDVGALAEAVRPAESGLIVPPNDVTALRQALAALLDDPVRRRSMGRAGHSLARERFDARANNQTLLDLVAEHIRLGAAPGEGRVIARFLETFFRYKLLILLPFFITPLVVVPFAFLLVRPYYETNAGLWVERPSYVPSTDDGNWNRYVTPAQNQQQRITELLKTRSFTDDIARRTSLAPLLESPEGKDDLFEYLGRAIYPIATGTKLLTIRVRAEDPQLSMEIIQGTVAAFRERAQNERMQSSSAAIAFYEQQMKDANDQATASRDRARRYITSNPRAVAPDPAAGPARVNLPTSAVDPQLADLTKRLENDEREVERIRTLLEQARFEASAALEGNDATLQLLDPPVFPTRPERERRRLLIFPAAAVAIGTLVSALLLVALTASDRSVRSTTDLSTMGRVIGVVPRMGLRRLPRQAGPDTTRRAIAFVAGTTLPALPAPRRAS